MARRSAAAALPDALSLPPALVSLDDDAPVDPKEQLENERLLKALLRRAARARKDPVEFFSFVMREERTQRRIRAAAHQRLLLQFVEDHPQCVIRMPVGSSKTFCMAGLTLWLLGNDPTARGAILSATQTQAMKPFSMVQDYLQDDRGAYPELHLVFPDLQPSTRAKDPWTQTKLVVDRPPGIRDPSLVAIGVGGSLPGARLSWILVDDLLDEENTGSYAARQKVHTWFDSTVLSRKDINGARVVVCNTPWNPDDQTYRLEKAGWACLTMSIDGEITITNADSCSSDECLWTGHAPGGGACPTCGARVNRWTSDELRPAVNGGGKRYRLAEHDSEDYGAAGLAVLPGDPPEKAFAYDADELVPLWPEVFPTRAIERLKFEYRHNMPAFNQTRRCVVRDDASAKVKEAWLEYGKLLGRLTGCYGLARGPSPASTVVVTGLDLALGLGEEHDFTAFFTFEVVPEIFIVLPRGMLLPGGRVASGERVSLKNMRRILDIDVGRYQGRVIVDKLIAKVKQFGSVAKVETNAAQSYLRQWTLDADVTIPVRAHVTGSNKHHRVYGVEGLFIELENGAWIIPCAPDGSVEPAVQHWLDDLLGYKPPPAHTGDALMASWLARSQARELDVGEADSGEGQGAGSVMAR